MNELMLAAFIVAVGLVLAAAATHLYQGVFREQAMLRYDGKTYLHTVGHLVMSFVCGPYIMLQMGWQQQKGSTLAFVPVLIGSLVGFGWAFITGLVFMSVYVAVML
ncbi:hypothetical protein XM25_09920 [Devosia sp. H5989]|nr:hypothetical protein XM25_09920 [Devosia sp. H5989]